MLVDEIKVDFWLVGQVLLVVVVVDFVFVQCGFVVIVVVKVEVVKFVGGLVGVLLLIVEDEVLCMVIVEVGVWFFGGLLDCVVKVVLGVGWVQCLLCLFVVYLYGYLVEVVGVDGQGCLFCVVSFVILVGFDDVFGYYYVCVCVEGFSVVQCCDGKDWVFGGISVVWFYLIYGCMLVNGLIEIDIFVLGV